ncbi:tetratricopeptide repeat protein [Micromonospora sp. DR5-3]|uniref:tetratricopeptide repeat protein n=1 Tax=unclassified Micromonospora TaxID=2617518 RepID=UPI001651B1FC|nr:MULTISPECIES: tetratricopeptide repeat protein [unclassified Micromonospora]MCW3816302.1 tetratricopeptide repeat protein [Micromonospora sp. DR5-3]
MQPDEARRPGSIEIPSDNPDGKTIRGRDKLVKELAKPFSWRYRHRERVLVLHGLGGGGKTATAAVFAHLMRDKGAQVWWVSASSDAQLQSGLRQVLYHLGAPQAEVDRAWAGVTSASDLLWRCLAEQKSKWLLVLDNVDDPSILASADAKVADGTGWLRNPPTRDGLVLVTSREGSPRRWAPWCRLQPLSRLSLSDATEVLIDYSDGQGGSRQDAERLADRLGRLPLALKLAGSYISDAAETPVAGAVAGFGSYCEALDAGRVDILDNQVDGTESEASKSRETITQTWNLSIELLERRGLVYVRRLIHLLAKFSDAPVPYSMLLEVEVLAYHPLFKGINPEDLVRHLKSLSHVGLIDLESDNSGSGAQSVARISFLYMHPLVRDVSRAADTDNERLTALAAGLLAVAANNEGFDSATDPAQWPVWQFLAPHAIFFAVELASTAQPDPRLVAALGPTASLTAKALRVIGHLWVAEVLLLTALEFMKHGTTSFDRTTKLDLRHELAIVLIDQGRANEASVHLAEIQQEVSAGGADVAFLLSVRHEAAIVMIDRGDLDNAEREFRGILSDARLAGLPDDDRNILGVQLELALVLIKKEEWGPAEALLKKLIERSTNAFGENSELTVTANLRLGRLYRETEDFMKALKYLESSLSAAQAVYLPDSPLMLAIRHEYAITLKAAGSKREARSELEDVVEACIRVLGEDHPSTQASIRALNELK